MPTSSSLRRLAIALVLSIVVTFAGAFVIDQGLGTESPSSPAGDAAPTAAGAVELRIVDFAYEPAMLPVKVGQEITIINEDNAKHTVTSGMRGNTDGTFDVVVAAGGSVTVTIDAAGSYPYICTIHPGMKGTIEVTP